MVINREDYGQLMLYYFPYCRELQALLEDVIRPGDICLDLGANVGLLTACMANRAGEDGRVISVEPNPPVAVQLKSMAGYFFPKCVMVASVGISANDGFGVLYLPEGRFSESIEVKQVFEGGEHLELLSVDTLVQLYLQGSLPDFIKLDIEGNEAYLLESMQGLFANGCRPVLLIEFHPEKCDHRGVKAIEIVQQLIKLGYQVRRVESVNGSYYLSDISDRPIGHDNLLFMTSAQLKAQKNWH